MIRNLSTNEHWFLRDMLYEAIFIPTGQPKLPETIVEDPSLSKYIANWGKDNLDVALVAEIDHELAGAIWGRLFSPDNKGYGFVDAQTPELSMAVKEEYRDKGIGTSLIKEMEKAYKNKGVKALSLSVDKRNQASKLYKRMGFKIVSEQETSLTMKKQIS